MQLAKSMLYFNNIHDFELTMFVVVKKKYKNICEPS